MNAFLCMLACVGCLDLHNVSVCARVHLYVCCFIQYLGSMIVLQFEGSKTTEMACKRMRVSSGAMAMCTLLVSSAEERFPPVWDKVPYACTNVHMHA